MFILFIRIYWLESRLLTIILKDYNNLLDLHSTRESNTQKTVNLKLLTLYWKTIIQTNKLMDKSEPTQFMKYFLPFRLIYLL